MRAKKCKSCGDNFSPVRPLQSVCGFECAAKVGRKISQSAEKVEAKRLKAELRVAKEKLKTLGDYKREAQIAINAYRREVTRHLGCISCGTHNGQMQGGHFRSVGGHPEMRYVEENIWCQCSRCNERLSGNLLEYRKNIVKILGVEKVEWLESKHEPKHYSIDDLKSIKAKYNKLTKELKSV